MTLEADGPLPIAQRLRRLNGSRSSPLGLEATKEAKSKGQRALLRRGTKPSEGKHSDMLDREA